MLKHVFFSKRAHVSVQEDVNPCYSCIQLKHICFTARIHVFQIRGVHKLLSRYPCSNLGVEAEFLFTYCSFASSSVTMQLTSAVEMFQNLMPCFFPSY